MNKRTSKLLSILLTLVMVLGMLPTVALAAQEQITLVQVQVEEPTAGKAPAAPTLTANTDKLYISEYSWTALTEGGVEATVFKPRHKYRFEFTVNVNDINTAQFIMSPAVTINGTQGNLGSVYNPHGSKNTAGKYATFYYDYTIPNDAATGETGSVFLNMNAPAAGGDPNTLLPTSTDSDTYTIVSALWQGYPSVFVAGQTYRLQVLIGMTSGNKFSATPKAYIGTTQGTLAQRASDAAAWFTWDYTVGGASSQTGGTISSVTLTNSAPEAGKTPNGMTASASGFTINGMWWFPEYDANGGSMGGSEVFATNHTYSAGYQIITNNGKFADTVNVTASNGTVAKVTRINETTIQVIVNFQPKSSTSVTVPITVTAPQAGQTYGTLSAPTVSDGSATITKYTWTHTLSKKEIDHVATDKIEIGDTYVLRVWLTPADGKTISAVTVNGDSAMKVNDYYGYEFTVSDGKTLSGTATVSGNLDVGGEAKATVSGAPSGAALQYQWQEYRKAATRYAWYDISGATSATFSLKDRAEGDTLRCVVTADGYGGEITSNTITVGKTGVPAAPTGLTGVAPTSATAKDGKITGTTTAMEYATKSDFSDAKTCAATATTGLASGTYYVRVKAVDATPAGTAAVVTVPEFGGYKITITKTPNGSVTANVTTAKQGDTVALQVTPDKGYTYDAVTVTDANGKEVPCKSNVFTMPASDVTVKVEFVKAPEVKTAFADVPSGAYYEDAVSWAVDKGVTSGTSATTFSPNAICTRAQAVTFLYRAAGSPEVPVSGEFSDVAADAYYAKAVAWAKANGITAGTSATTFAPDATCTRAQIVTFLHRAAGTPTASGTLFSDVAATAYYAGAVQWAVAKGITNGSSATTFSPDANCTRAQIVTFLYRYMGK